MVKRSVIAKASPGEAGRVHSIQLGLYRTALREREDNILPYGGWGILDGPFNQAHQNVIVTTAKTSPGGLGQGLGWYQS